MNKEFVGVVLWTSMVRELMNKEAPLLSKNQMLHSMRDCHEFISMNECLRIGSQWRKPCVEDWTCVGKEKPIHKASLAYFILVLK